CRRQLRREFLEVDSQSSTRDGALFLQLGHYVTNQVDRNCESNSLVSTASGQDRGIDANQFTAAVDERTAGVAGIDRSIRLNEVLIVFDAEASTAGSADDSHGHRLAETKGIAHGERDIADVHFGRIAQSHVREVSGIDLD